MNTDMALIGFIGVVFGVFLTVGLLRVFRPATKSQPASAPAPAQKLSGVTQLLSQLRKLHIQVQPVAPKVEAKWFCGVCGYENRVGANNCSHCGVQFTTPQTKVLSHTCTKCGKALGPRSKFCPHCGIKIN